MGYVCAALHRGAAQLRGAHVTTGRSGPAENGFDPRWMFWMVGLVLALSILAAIYVQHYAQYPMPMWRGWIFRYLLFHQDMVGLALLAAIAVLACFPATHRPAAAHRRR